MDFQISCNNLIIVPIHQKKSKCKKENYRPVSVLSNLSKIHQKLLYNQLCDYFDIILFPSQCGFRNKFTAQYCLLVMTEKFKEAIDRRNEFGAISKAFDCINHLLIIAKVHSYGFHLCQQTWCISYLRNHTQRTKINESFSERFNIVHGVPVR